MADSLIKLQDLKKEYDGTPVLRGISLDIKSREFVTLLGPSGCGKTTTLRIIGGFEQPDSGDVFFEVNKFMMVCVLLKMRKMV